MLPRHWEGKGKEGGKRKVTALTEHHAVKA